MSGPVWQPIDNTNFHNNTNKNAITNLQVMYVENNRKYVVWACTAQTGKENERPRDVVPQPGCLNPNCMTTKHQTLPKWFQSSACRHAGCTKRIRLNAGNSWLFDTIEEAEEQMERIRRGDFV